MKENTRWDAQLKVGSEVIDNQHKVLFDLIKDLNNAMQARASVRIIDVLLGVLLDYAFQHFQTEEDYFANHADFTRHCFEHYTLLKKLNVFILDIRNNRIKDDKRSSAFFGDWLVEHIERFDIPFFSHETVNAGILHEHEAIDEFDTDREKRRQHKRLLHNEVVDGDIHVQVYNATKLKSGKAKIVNMSPGGLMLKSVNDHEIDDLLIVGCSIGKNFKMEEKVKVKAVHDQMYSVQFVASAPETIDFFTKLYGAVHLNRAKLG
jgi:hemerythrin-like metal-binding protein